MQFLMFQTNGLFSSSSPTFWWSSWMLWSSLWAGFELLGLDEFETLWCGLLSGKSFNVIPIPMSRSPVPCSSVNGFVNIKYDSNNVTAFLAVVICKKNIQWKSSLQDQEFIWLTLYYLFVHHQCSWCLINVPRNQATRPLLYANSNKDDIYSIKCWHHICKSRNKWSCEKNVPWPWWQHRKVQWGKGRKLGQ